MKFCELLTLYREKKGLSKTELAKKIGVSPIYIMNIEAGRKKPPTLERVSQIINILSLTDKEINDFLKLAIAERIPPKERELFIKQYLQKPIEVRPSITPEILEALQDPIALKALLITHKNKQDIKNTIKNVLECLPNLTSEKRKAILALCQ
jgi:transcriptional regulator with XRE-family HTH domain